MELEKGLDLSMMRGVRDLFIQSREIHNVLCAEGKRLATIQPFEPIEDPNLLDALNSKKMTLMGYLALHKARCIPVPTWPQMDGLIHWECHVELTFLSERLLAQAEPAYLNFFPALEETDPNDSMTTFDFCIYPSVGRIKVTDPDYREIGTSMYPVKDGTTCPSALDVLSYAKRRWYDLHDEDKEWLLQFLAGWVLSYARKFPTSKIPHLPTAVASELCGCSIPNYFGDFNAFGEGVDEVIWEMHRYGVVMGWEMQRWTHAFSQRVLRKADDDISRRRKPIYLDSLDNMVENQTIPIFKPSLEQLFEQREEVNSYISRWTEQEQAVMQLKANNYSRNEIAAILELTTRQVKTDLQRAREIAREDAARIRAVEEGTAPKAIRRRRQKNN